MAIFSGRYGSVDGISQIQNWSIDWTMADNPHSNSFTKAGKQRDTGVQDWTGSFTSEGVLSNVKMSSFELKCQTGGPTFGGNGVEYSGSAIYTQIGISADISQAGRVIISCSFSGNGPLSRGTSGSNDTITPQILYAKDCVVKLGGSVIDWQQFNFTITNEVQTYVGASTVDNEGNVWTHRYPGLYDCSGLLTCTNSEIIGENGMMGELSIVCGGTNLLQISNVRLLSTSGISADPSSGALLGYTANLGMCAHDDSGQLGVLKLFDSQIWPETVV